MVYGEPQIGADTAETGRERPSIFDKPVENFDPKQIAEQVSGAQNITVEKIGKATEIGDESVDEGADTDDFPDKTESVDVSERRPAVPTRPGADSAEGEEALPEEDEAGTGFEGVDINIDAGSETVEDTEDASRLYDKLSELEESLDDSEFGKGNKRYFGAMLANVRKFLDEQVSENEIVNRKFNLVKDMMSFVRTLVEEKFDFTKGWVKARKAFPYPLPVGTVLNNEGKDVKFFDIESVKLLHEFIDLIRQNLRDGEGLMEDILFRGMPIGMEYIDLGYVGDYSATASKPKARIKELKKLEREQVFYLTAPRAFDVEQWPLRSRGGTHRTLSAVAGVGRAIANGLRRKEKVEEEE